MTTIESPSKGSEQSGMSNTPSSVVEPTPNQRDPSPEVGPSNGSSAPPEPPKIPLAEWHKRVQEKIRDQRVPGKMRIKVLKAYVIGRPFRKNGNPYTQVSVEFEEPPSTEQQVKRTADFTEEAVVIFKANLQPGCIYDVTQKELDDRFVHWTAIKPVSAK